MHKFGFIGTGVMAGAMLKSALQAGFLESGDILVYDKNPLAAQNFGATAAQDAKQVAEQCEIVQLGVKPQVLPTLLEEISAQIQDKLVVSIAAGVTLAQLAPFAPRVVRLMPNINAAAGKSCTTFCATEQVTAQEIDFIQNYCMCFGTAIALEEMHFSASLAIAASGPAFVYLFIDELARAGVTAGLPRAKALELATQCVLGSATMVQESNTHPCQLADQVCSPGGTTIAGVNALRKHGFSHAVSQAVLAAAARDKELGILNM